MYRLLLLRHAKAMWAKPGMKDYDRPLDVEGQSSLDRLAKAIEKSAILPDRIVLSGSCRTKETAFGLIRRLGAKIETVIDDTIYSGSPSDYLQSIRIHGNVKTFMLVGHNPSIEDLALALCNNGQERDFARLRAGFPTAAIATIAFEKPLYELSQTTGVLESFPSP